MRDSWLEVVDGLLRPARARLEECVREGELERASARLVAEKRARALDDCQRRIEATRAVVFAADDGVIPAAMTDLEREWRTLSRVDPDGGLMDLWARVAPRAWLDHKRWRHSDVPARLDAAVALASDVPGVEAAEAAARSLRLALAAWGVHLGSAIRFRAFDEDTDYVSVLLANTLHAAREAVARRREAPIMFDRARQVDRAVHEAVSLRFPDRPLLARALAQAAFVDRLLHAAAIVDRPNPTTPLRALWQTGYGLAAVDAAGVTLEVPALP